MRLDIYVESVSMRMSKALTDVLKSNPWKDIAKEWLADIRQGHTVKKWVLQDDQDAVEAYNKKNKRNALHWELPPCPFVGHPSAKIWYLLKNPGYSDIDVYDQIDIKKGKQLILQPKEMLLPREDEIAALMARQEMIVKALMFDLDPNGCFYVLAHEFNTCKLHKKCLGAYNWYDANFFPVSGGYFKCGDEMSKLTYASKNVFDLEYSPYHSASFGKFEDHKKFKHHEFWRRLVEFALRRQKFLIVRSNELCEEVRLVSPKLFAKACKDGRVYVCNSRSARVAKNNLLMPSPDGTCELEKFCSKIKDVKVRTAGADADGAKQ